ncbi:MAG TPA: hypothetical protein VK106_01380 [Balneolaceae bacterium]|nr:hypothetical protein [Balneolaceae bacterium]
MIAALVGTILYQVISPAITPVWLNLIIEIAVIIIFGFIGAAVSKAIGHESTKVTKS